MSESARTPEELETLLEDALMIRDRGALAALFAEGAVLIPGDNQPARGDGIARLALATWDGEHTYVADLWRVVQARDVALIVAQGGINVARRGHDGAWRYAIVVQAPVEGTDRRQAHGGPDTSALAGSAGPNQPGTNAARSSRRRRDPTRH